MKVTIRQVAQEAGVSIATVSRVLNGYTDIGQETRERVIAVAKSLGYVPNAAARALSSKQYRKIAMVINDLKVSRSNTIPLEVLTGVYEIADIEDVEYILLLTNSRDQERKSLKQYGVENNISGFVLLGFSLEDRYIEELKTLTIPHVLVDIHPIGPASYSVSVDNEEAAYCATKYLVDHGHQHIGMISGKDWAQVSQDRVAGFQRCLNKEVSHHVTAPVIEGLFSEEYTQSLMSKLMTDCPELTAIFCASDLMAIGAIKGLKALGLQVPRDLSVIGFDDITISKYITPSLTTVKQDMHEIGRQACRILLDVLEKGELEQKQYFVEHQLVIRESVRDLVVKE